MKKKASDPKQLAALHALGALDGPDALAFAESLVQDPNLRRDTAAFAAITESLAQSLPVSNPPPGLKETILRKAEASRARTQVVANIQKCLPIANQGLAFLREAGAAGWVQLPVAGASVKLLSFDEKSGYAVVLGKLEAGSRYPSHSHIHPEDIFMLSGDLHVGDEVMGAGDFHHAEAGSRHGVNWSATGCVLLCVLSKEDLLRQLVPA